MTSRKLGLCLTPPPPSFTLKWMFYLDLYTWCHTWTKPPSPYFRDVIYEWPLSPFWEAVVRENVKFHRHNLRFCADFLEFNDRFFGFIEILLKFIDNEGVR